MPSDAAYHRAYRKSRRNAGKPIQSKQRSGDRHKTRTGHRGKQLSKWDRRLLIAWDGEGYTDVDGITHLYNLLASSDGSSISDPSGLGTERIFEYVLRQSNPKAINVIYGGSYDVNMWLRDIPIAKLLELWNTGTVLWKHYKISYAHRKKFSVTEQFYGKGAPKPRTFILWDVLGYFQSTFVVACRKWLGDLPILDEIERMKQLRSGFSEEQFSEVAEYNRSELVLLVSLMTSLFEAMDEAGIVLTRYDGAGSIAAFLLRVNNVKEHMGDQPLEVQRWSQRAYSGGRIEAIKIGNKEEQKNGKDCIFRADINSAYPSACIGLPSFKGARWSASSEWNESPYSLVEVEYSFPTGKPFYPLWNRDPSGSISYPRAGHGTYWGVEIQTAIKHNPGCIRIKSAYNVELATNHKPFVFIENVYKQRLIFKQRGSMASEALKLGLNSIYGKLAQQAGYHGGRIPTYHNLAWAGLITAFTRSKLYEVSQGISRSVIAFATDAVISTVPMADRVVNGTAIGEWSCDAFTGITIVQAGVYWLCKGGEWQSKYRGFDKGSLSRSDIIETWKRWYYDQPCNICQWVYDPPTDADHIHATLTRFVGMGGALNTKDFYAHWTHWERMSRRLTILPTGKRTRLVRRRRGYEVDPLTREPYYERLVLTQPLTNTDPDKASTPYYIEWLDGPDAVKSIHPKEQGIPGEVLEQEEEDSYA